jgi:uncharacterized membrane protein YfcA
MSVSLAAAAVVFGLLAGGAAGLLGIGGGALMVPFLVVVAGLDQTEAAATSLAVILPTGLVASRRLAVRGIGDLKRALLVGTVGAVGSVTGALLALALPEAALRVLFAVFMAAVGARLLRDALRTPAGP